MRSSLGTGQSAQLGVRPAGPHESGEPGGQALVVARRPGLFFCRLVGHKSNVIARVGRTAGEKSTAPGQKYRVRRVPGIFPGSDGPLTPSASALAARP
ncbi:hypothetical protein [Fodinicola feengrottensis]|uniref:hypothetical protein n=1 Tax=Fodinicola feengrottensis TaxID=435914 RepID=UPI002442A282|nr:hypothetical protein [Fodinicola feengrottensis]